VHACVWKTATKYSLTENLMKDVMYKVFYSHTEQNVLYSSLIVPIFSVCYDNCSSEYLNSNFLEYFLNTLLES
jgi:hypothetical protein